jgi:hypothetical protein
MVKVAPLFYPLTTAVSRPVFFNYISTQIQSIPVEHSFEVPSLSHFVNFFRCLLMVKVNTVIRNTKINFVSSL